MDQPWEYFIGFHQGLFVLQILSFVLRLVGIHNFFRKFFFFKTLLCSISCHREAIILSYIIFINLKHFCACSILLIGSNQLWKPYQCTSDFKDPHTCKLLVGIIFVNTQILNLCLLCEFLCFVPPLIPSQQYQTSGQVFLEILL